MRLKKIDNSKIKRLEALKKAINQKNVIIDVPKVEKVLESFENHIELGYMTGWRGYRKFVEKNMRREEKQQEAGLEFKLKENDDLYRLQKELYKINTKVIEEIENTIRGIGVSPTEKIPGIKRSAFVSTSRTMLRVGLSVATPVIFFNNIEAFAANLGLQNLMSVKAIGIITGFAAGFCIWKVTGKIYKGFDVRKQRKITYESWKADPDNNLTLKTATFLTRKKWKQARRLIKKIKKQLNTLEEQERKKEEMKKRKEEENENKRKEKDENKKKKTKRFWNFIDKTIIDIEDFFNKLVESKSKKETEEIKIGENVNEREQEVKEEEWEYCEKGEEEEMREIIDKSEKEINDLNEDMEVDELIDELEKELKELNDLNEDMEVDELEKELKELNDLNEDMEVDELIDELEKELNKLDNK